MSVSQATPFNVSLSETILTLLASPVYQVRTEGSQGLGNGMGHHQVFTRPMGLHSHTDNEGSRDAFNTASAVKR